MVKVTSLMVAMVLLFPLCFTTRAERGMGLMASADEPENPPSFGGPFRYESNARARMAAQFVLGDMYKWIVFEREVIVFTDDPETAEGLASLGFTVRPTDDRKNEKYKTD